MMPENLSGNFETYKNNLYDQLGLNNPNSNYFGLNIIIGSFVE